MTGSSFIPSQASDALALLRRCLADDLVGVYLHGSAVAGGLRAHSDVDILAVVDRPMDRERRRALLGHLLPISAYPVREGGPRPLEVIIFQQADLRDGAYPPRAEFIYGEWRRQYFEAGGIPQPERDAELVPMLAWAREIGVALFGPPAHDLLPAVPIDRLRRAMGEALPALVASLEGDERNVLLTLARIWHTLGTGGMVPKDVAAQWAIARLPDEPGRLLGLARADYLGFESGRRLGRECPAAIEHAVAHLRRQAEQLLT